MSDLDDEIQSHLEHEIDCNVARGMSHEQARTAALRKFGSRLLVKEEIWRLRPWACLDGIRQDLRYAVRMMRRDWGFTIVAIASLALGLGGNAALFSLISRLLLQSLPVREPSRLVELVVARRAFTANGYSYPDYLKLKSLDLFDGFAGWMNRRRRQDVDWDGIVKQQYLTVVTGDYFTTLGVQPAAGRLLNAKDDSPAGGDAAVISYAAWQREFQLNPAVIGRKFRWEHGVFTVVGVMPQPFHGIEVGPAPDIILPIHATPRAFPDSKIGTDNNFFDILLVARLKTGDSPRQIEPVLTDRMDKLTPQPFDKFVRKFTLHPSSTAYSRVGADFGYGLWLLLGLSGVVLLAACANLATLQLVRAGARRQEMSIRRASGASTGRLIRQWFTESVLLAIIGGALGLLASKWITAALLLFLPDAQRSFYRFSVDGRVLLISMLLTVSTALIFGVAPGWRAARDGDWKLGGRGSVGCDGAKWTKPVIAMQLALSLVLLLGAALFGRSLQELISADCGFDRQGLVVSWIDSPRKMSKLTGDAMRNRQLALLDRIRALPQVSTAAMAWFAPLKGDKYWDPLRIPGYTPSDNEDMTVLENAVSPGFFRVMGIPILAGRDFDEHDSRGTARVAIVSESLARRFFGGLDIIGRVVSGGRLELTQNLRIVGVVGNTRYSQVRESGKIQLYILTAQVADDDFWGHDFIARLHPGVSSGAAIASISGLRAALDRQETLKVKDYAEIYGRVIAQDQMIAILAAAFGALGAGLALIGLYGSVAWSVTRRTSELGLRMALGSSPGQIAWLIGKETVVLATLGLLLGVPLGVVASRLVEARLYQVRALDPVAMTAVAVVLALVSLVAAILPARRAASIDPAIALRTQ